jgi:GxxExxY protein
MLSNNDLNEIGGIILDAAITVHREFGPGLLETVYHFGMMKELEWREVSSKQKVMVPLFYKGFNTGKCFEIDHLVENEIILEYKSVENILPIHKAQLLTYLRLSNKRLGYLINFNEELLKDGFKRMVNGF